MLSCGILCYIIFQLSLRIKIPLFQWLKKNNAVACAILFFISFCFCLLLVTHSGRSYFNRLPFRIDMMAEVIEGPQGPPWRSAGVGAGPRGRHTGPWRVDNTGVALNVEGARWIFWGTSYQPPALIQTRLRWAVVRMRSSGRGGQRPHDPKRLVGTRVWTEGEAFKLLNGLGGALL